MTLADMKEVASVLNKMSDAIRSVAAVLNAGNYESAVNKAVRMTNDLRPENFPPKVSDQVMDFMEEVNKKAMNERLAEIAKKA